MSFFEMLETLLIGPLKLIFEMVFMYANDSIGNPGWAIVILSVTMNMLVLPLYKRADIMQEKAREIEIKIQDGVKHIKKTFSGDERMMILQTYYRQNNYKPTDGLKGSVSLMLEIPFFMAAYRFLSNLEVFDGASFGVISDLSAPDGLLVIGGMTINILPFIMTLINVISSTVYLKGSTTKTRVQLYTMALIFLIFLYKSPSCLVFYWTMNNIFSLAKNIYYKLKNSQKLFAILVSVLGWIFGVYGLSIYSVEHADKSIFLMITGILFQLPLYLYALKTTVHIKLNFSEISSNRKMFLMSSLFLTMLIGVLIPSVYIAASPQEYVDINYFYNPLWYIVSSFLLAAGTFLIWMGVFYWLANTIGKYIYEKLMWILCGVMLINYMFFGTELGVISAGLQYGGGVDFTLDEYILNFRVLGILIIIMYVFSVKWKHLPSTLLSIAIIAIIGMSTMNVVNIKKSVDEIDLQGVTSKENTPNFQLNQDGKNVVVIMLDRAMNEYIPYIFNEKPELQEQFSGFTYYSNTISYGGHTNFGVPALIGGYEYTPVEMNKRSSETLVSKHNEALKVMPKIFLENGYEVTVCDPVYANYQWIPDLSIYSEYPEIKTYITDGKFNDMIQRESVIRNNNRNFFCFSLMKSVPLCFQAAIYDGGQYNRALIKDELVYTYQKFQGLSVAEGIYYDFMEAYNVLLNLPRMTTISNDGKNTFLFMSNDLPHQVMLLQEPEYVPVQYVDNTEYDAENEDRFLVDSRVLDVKNVSQMGHYQTNMATLIQLGNWFDYLRDNDVYDNTRIILVSDHGRALHHHEELIYSDDSDNVYDVEAFYPLLMMKDFDSNEFVTSDEFMTNADVPTLAMKDIIQNPVNPFTGKEINNDEKYAHDQYIILSSEWAISRNDGNTFLPSTWASVKDNIWEEDNWAFSEESVVLTEHEMPR